MTHRQRFGMFNDGYAANSLGSPNMTNIVDYTVFKKTPEQKSDTVAAIHKHRQFMKKAGLNHNKVLNIPEHRLDEPIIITT